MNVRLIKLAKEYYPQLSEMIDEWKIDHEMNHTNRSPWAIFKNDYRDFDYYLENLEIKVRRPDSIYDPEAAAKHFLSVLPPEIHSLKALKKLCVEYGLESKQFSGEALQKMISYNWPGNVRELENAIERAITLCDTNIIYSEHLKIGKGSIPTTMKEMLAKEEERILEMTLLKYNGDKNKAMAELDMSKTVFYDKLKRYNIRY